MLLRVDLLRFRNVWSWWYLRLVSRIDHLSAWGSLELAPTTVRKAASCLIETTPCRTHLVIRNCGSSERHHLLLLQKAVARILRLLPANENWTTCSLSRWHYRIVWRPRYLSVIHLTAMLIGGWLSLWEVFGREKLSKVESFTACVHLVDVVQSLIFGAILNLNCLIVTVTCLIGRLKGLIQILFCDRGWSLLSYLEELARWNAIKVLVGHVWSLSWPHNCARTRLPHTERLLVLWSLVRSRFRLWFWVNSSSFACWSSLLVLWCSLALIWQKTRHWINGRELAIQIDCVVEIGCGESILGQSKATHVYRVISTMDGLISQGSQSFIHWHGANICATCLVWSWVLRSSHETFWTWIQRLWSFLGSLNSAGCGRSLLRVLVAACVIVVGWWLHHCVVCWHDHMLHVAAGGLTPTHIHWVSALMGSFLILAGKLVILRNLGIFALRLPILLLCV